MLKLNDKIAVVTGASSGVGRAIALGLAKQGTKVCLLGRNMNALEAVNEVAKLTALGSKSHQTDFIVDGDIERIKECIEHEFGCVDILIHSAGILTMGTVECSSVDDFDIQYRTNVRAPYLLTQALLPMIKSRQGQIVFLNSSVGLNAKGTLGQYAASKHALKALADSLREEVNADGIRVLSVFLGRTATPMQVKIHEIEGREYQVEKLIQPGNIAAIVINALTLPYTVEVTDISMRPLAKL